ncbi:hypothetical protein OG429_38015 [Streptomyces sp. NBC_00190]|uniref:hypothetical protein n=1 Tax=Streptomyces sp. NBC_00190 TaxID=2903634 RepID=UPI002E2E6CEF|nr:hypothetical protein [Streptomyces sp. NBC_00190]
MTNIDMKPETAIDTDIDTNTQTFEVVSGTEAEAPHHKGSKKNKGRKSKARRRVAKALAYFSLVFSGLLVLAEPWLLIPVIALVLAVSLWD